ncbi:MAG: hypothetical protein KIT22_19420, partial [Verrucomicrobiae bacterium]|nr:hypothetical protein [Verrucomicrobiae bacterium]
MMFLLPLVMLLGWGTIRSNSSGVQKGKFRVEYAGSEIHGTHRYVSIRLRNLGWTQVKLSGAHVHFDVTNEAGEIHAWDRCRMSGGSPLIPKPLPTNG